MRYIAFLRAVNVAGRFVTMERLRGLFEELGFTGVRTHIQSGNVFFETGKASRATLTGKIKRHLRAALDWDVAVFLRTPDEVAATLALEPFAKIRPTDDMRFCVIFISEPLPKDARFPFVPPKGDFELLHATSGEVFATMRLINGRPSNPTAFIEKTYGVKATARFFTTTAKILAAAID
jgi:uncharacterized protein (DUF1697 family)